MSDTSIASGDNGLAQLIIDSSTDFAIITTDVGGIVTSWNSGAENILGWTAQEAIGMSCRQMFTREDQAAGVPDEEMRRATADGRAIDERLHARKDGSHLWGSGVIMPLRRNGQAGPHGFLKVLRDRTVERAAERRYDAMSAAFPGFLFVTDADGNNTETNELFRAYTGRSEAELAGSGWADSLHADDRERAQREWARAVASGDIYEVRSRFRRFDGEYRCFACRAVPERDHQGHTLRWVGTCIDVENEARARAALERLNVTLEHKVNQGEADLATAIENLQGEIASRLNVEDALRQAQKMEAVGQLTGGVAHDFNNLLTIIRSSADLLRRPELSDSRRRRYVDAIADTADRAATLTRQLLAFARRQPLLPEVFDVAGRVKHLASLLKTTIGSRVKLLLDAECDAGSVEADPNQFDTAILNIVVNARDAMNGEGTLTIVVSAVSGIPKRRSHAARPGNLVAVSVGDTGCGIAPDTLSRIFEPFFTTKEIGKGTGLGLSQVFGFAKQSGGDVTVDSAEGRGTTFTLYLPRAEDKPLVNAPHSPDSPVEFGRDRCVLVVEDTKRSGSSPRNSSKNSVSRRCGPQTRKWRST